MAVYAFANGKGGVGKTVTTVNAGMALSSMGHDVVVVDADLAMGNLDQYVDGDGDVGIHTVLAGECKLEDALASGPGDLSIVPGQRSLDAIGSVEPAKVRQIIERLEAYFDFVLVDTPAGLQDELAVVLGHADCSLMISTPEPVALGCARHTAELAERVDATVLGLVVTRANPETHPETIERYADLPLVRVVPEDPAVDWYPTVVEESHGGSPAGDEYETLARVLESTRDAEAPMAALENDETISLPGTHDGDAESDEEPEDDPADDLISQDGIRMGSARSAEEHLERVQDAIDRSTDDA